MKEQQTLVFVYNAKSGVQHKAMDFLHKAISPATYQCSLCAITYGTFTIKNEWKAFIQSLPIPAAFLYKDEVQTQYPGYQLGYPAILLQSATGLKLLVSSTEMASLELEQLMQLLRERLRQQGILSE